MKYTRFIAIAGLILSAVGLCNAELTNLPNGFSTADPYEIMQGSTSVIGVPGDGDLFVQDDLQVVGKVDLREVITMVDYWDALAAKSSGTIYYTNLITTASAVGGKKYVRGTEFVNQGGVAPRNLQVFIDTETLVTAVAPTVTCSIQGLSSRGNIVTEDIDCSTTSATAGVWAYWIVYGATITIVSPYLSSFAFAIGTGDKIGLMGDVDETSDVDVMTRVSNVYYNGETAQVTVNTTYDTWTHADVPDGSDDYIVVYRVNTEARNVKSSGNHPY